MCGRGVIHDHATIERYFDVRPPRFQLTNRFNVAPSIDVSVIRAGGGEHAAVGLRCGGQLTTTRS